ncbi:SAM-dependent methyltransferase [Enterococcus sp. JM4C]|uniref:tRNA (mnm(5)s(2)U34)-methyltransferase n=1 Tax=Candidatus Enterococcus huntleyi TaxID=1857217 RepID=UPI00137A0B93|nr:class I SAM-dependent methyltransferase [Enterococcus sp. JM4C]KAF1296690.1 SAM-dependent methyltransferase [Enterococcus sp. JM4C]
MLQTALHYSHTLIKEVLQPGDNAIDATMGNGFDTLFLADLVGKTGKVFSFDVQEQAVKTTQEKLIAAGLDTRAQLYLQGHETLGEVLDPDFSIKAAIFNLGYLPKSDKSIITLPSTTKKAMTEILLRLVPRGRLILVAYYGHVGGTEELDMVRNYCEALPQEQFSVLNYQFINQKNQPPILFCIERKKP